MGKPKTLNDTFPRREDRVRFGSDGNGVFVAVRKPMRRGYVWTIVTDLRDADLDILDVIDRNDVTRHFTGNPNV